MRDSTPRPRHIADGITNPVRRQPNRAIGCAEERSASFEIGRVRTAHLNPCLKTARTLFFQSTPGYIYGYHANHSRRCGSIAETAPATDGSRVEAGNGVHII